MNRMNSAKRRARRRALIERDGEVCAYCGRLGGTGEPFSRLSLDHVVPRSHGGSNALTNLRLCCKPCNCMKGSLTIDTWLGTVRAIAARFEGAQAWAA